MTGEAGPTIDAALPRSYDVIVFADVLEHVAQPDQILAWAASKLAVDGRIIALIPNSANWKFRRKMLHGDWSYAETGYFDRDHLGFSTFAPPARWGGRRDCRRSRSSSPASGCRSH